jgi:hypothetical protein
VQKLRKKNKKKKNKKDLKNKGNNYVIKIYAELKEFELNYTRLHLKKKIVLSSKLNEQTDYINKHNNNILNNIDIINIYEKNMTILGYILKKKKKDIIISISKKLLTSFFIKNNIITKNNNKHYINANTKLKEWKITEIYNYYYMIYIKLFKYYY